MSIALLRDPAKSLFASGRMLSRHQADPRSETAARRERLPTSYFGHQSGGDDWAPPRRDNGAPSRPPAARCQAPRPSRWIGQDRLHDIPGVGTAIADIIRKLHATGSHRRSTPCERRFPKGCSKCSRYPACPEPQPKSGPSGPRAQSLSQAAPLQYGRTVRHWRRLTLLRHFHRAISRRGYDQLSTLKPVVGVAFALRRSKWARVRRDVHFLPPVVGR